MTEQEKVDALYDVPAKDADELEDLRTFVAMIALREGPATSAWTDDVRNLAKNLWKFYGTRARMRMDNDDSIKRPDFDFSGLAVNIRLL